MENMKRRLVEAIKDCNELCRDCDKKGACAECFLYKEYEKEAEALLERGVLVPPVKIGDVVYAAVDLDDTGLKIEEYTVGGLEYQDGKWFVCEANEQYEFFEVGTDLALLTREDAEALAEEMRVEQK